MSCFWGHKWEKWERYDEQRYFVTPENGKKFQYTAVKQKRKCKKCGFTEVKIIDGVGA